MQEVLHRGKWPPSNIMVHMSGCRHGTDNAANIKNPPCLPAAKCRRNYSVYGSYGSDVTICTRII